MPRIVAEREGFLDQPDRLHRFPGGTDVGFVAGSHREHQGIEEDIFGGHPVFLRQQGIGAAGHRQLPLPIDGHPPFVDHPDDHRRPVPVDEGTTAAKRSSPSSRLIELMIAFPWE